MESYKGWHSSSDYFRCGSPNYKVTFYPIYLWGGNPPQQDQTLAPNRDGGHQIKRQKSFGNDHPKNSLAVLNMSPYRRASTRRIGVREIGNADFDGADGQHTTASNRMDVKGVFGVPRSSHPKSVLMQHVPYYSPSCYERWKWGNATHTSSHRFQCGMHLYGTDTVKMAWSSRWTNIRHDSRPQWAGTGSQAWKSINGIYSSVCGAIINGSIIRCASCASEGW